MVDLLQRLRHPIITHDQYGRCVDAVTLASDAKEAADEIERLRTVLKECADDLEAEVEGHYQHVKDHPAMAPKYERDMASVRKAREILG